MSKILFYATGALVAVAVLKMLIASVLGGLFVGGLLFLAWAGIWRLLTFVFLEKDELELDEFSRNLRKLGLEPSSQPSRVLEFGESPATFETSRLVETEESLLRVREGSPRSEGSSSEDQDFADFLRSDPFH